MKRLQTIAAFAAAGALLVVPSVGQAHHKPGHTKGGNGAKGCKKPTVNKGFVAKGTLVAFTADNTNTAAHEESVTLTVTRMNRHARRADLTDALTGAANPGLQYKVDGSGASGDHFTVQLSEFEAGETPGPGDSVKVIGKVAVTKKKCAGPGDTLADRYGTVNVRKVQITEVD